MVRRTHRGGTYNCLHIEKEREKETKAANLSDVRLEVPLVAAPGLGGSRILWEQQSEHMVS